MDYLDTSQILTNYLTWWVEAHAPFRYPGGHWGYPKQPVRDMDFADFRNQFLGQGFAQVIVVTGRRAELAHPRCLTVSLGEQTHYLNGRTVTDFLNEYYPRERWASYRLCSEWMRVRFNFTLVVNRII